MNSQESKVKLSDEQKHFQMCYEALTKRFMSTKIMALMTFYCISEIFYKRNLLNAKFFDEQIINSTSIRVFKKNIGNNKIAMNYKKWFKIIKDAIKKNYISKLKITIFKDINMTEPVEMYSLKYKFLGYINTGVEPEPEQLYNDTMNTVDSLITTLATLNELPSDKAISFVIAYNDLTPDYYVESNTDDDDIKIPIEDAFFMKHSVIETPFHKLKVASEYNKKFHTKIEECICLMTADIDTIKCYCPFKDIFSQILYCKICFEFSHSMCYGIYSMSENEKIEHICINCCLANKDTVECTDMSLIDLKEYDKQFISYLRRGLIFALTKTSFTNVDFKCPNTTDDETNIVLEVLIKLGAFTQDNNIFIPNHNKINEICKKIFNYKNDNYDLSFFLSQNTKTDNKKVNNKRKVVPDENNPADNMEINSKLIKKNKKQKLTTIITRSQTL